MKAVDHYIQAAVARTGCLEMIAYALGRHQIWTEELEQARQENLEADKDTMKHPYGV